MLQVIQFMKGYLCIRVWGFSTERFINLCGNHNILLWNIRNCGNYDTMCITLKGFYNLKSITRKTGTRVVITRRCGLPFFIQRVKKRKIFAGGIIFCFLFWLWMESFILDIEIQGNYFISEEVFMDFLSEERVTPGMKKKNVNIEALEKSVRNKFDLITWTSAKIDGTKLVIQLKENDLIQTIPEKQEENGKGYNLIAGVDGVVTDMVTRNGVPKVSIGKEVKKGDVLVEGYIPIYLEDMTVKRYDYCTADADVIIESSMTVSKQQDENYKKKIYTGKSKNRYFVRLPMMEIKLPIGKISYKKYDVLEECEQIILFGGYRIPVVYGKKQIREYVEEDAIYTKEEIKLQFEQKVQKIIQTLDEKGVQIIEKNVTINKYKGIWTLMVDFRVSQQADILQEIQIPQITESARK